MPCEKVVKRAARREVVLHYQDVFALSGTADMRSDGLWASFSPLPVAA
jgi:hypothetical protein